MVVFEELFNESNGQAIEYDGKELKLAHRIPVNGSAKFLLNNLKTKSKWRQGFALKGINGELFCNGEKSPSFVFWEDTFPGEIELEVQVEALVIYNVWDVGNGVMQYGHNGAAMYVKEGSQSTTIFCNDGFPDDDLDNLQFSVTKLK